MKANSELIVAMHLAGSLAALLIARGVLKAEEVEGLVRGGIEGMERLAKDPALKHVYREVAEDALRTIMAVAEKLK
jgi:hypothetical protein